MPHEPTGSVGLDEARDLDRMVQVLCSCFTRALHWLHRSPELRPPRGLTDAVRGAQASHSTAANRTEQTGNEQRLATICRSTAASARDRSRENRKEKRAA